ncbi:MAG: hypothetical protein V3S12_04310 [Acidiferrobacterales bacterium]
MRNFLSIIIVTISLITTSPASANTNATRMARDGMDMLMRLEFDRAILAFEHLESRFPDYPMNSVLKASVYWIKAEASQGDMKKRAWDEAFFQLTRAIDIAKQGLEKHPDNHLWKLNLGMATFFAGRAEVARHNTLKAMRYARKSRDILRSLIKERPDTEDAYFVLGMYEYLAGSVPRGQRWITYILDMSGDRELGIRYLERTTTRGEIMAPEAARILLAAAAVQPEYNDPCKYIPLARDTRKKYPQNPHYSAALQLILAHCGYPKESLAENERAFRVYLERFPDMTDSLNLAKLQVYPAMGALEEIEKLAPLFKSKNYFHWYLAKAQALDVLGQRKKAVAMYLELEMAVDNPDESTLFTDMPPDSVYEKARVYLKKPYRRSEPARIDKNTAPVLNVPGATFARRFTLKSISQQ